MTTKERFQKVENIFLLRFHKKKFSWLYVFDNTQAFYNGYKEVNALLNKITLLNGWNLNAQIIFKHVAILLFYLHFKNIQWKNFIIFIKIFFGIIKYYAKF